jgi:D-alanine-D-alanine ligase
VLPPDHPDSASEADVAEVARAVAEALVRKKLDAWPVPIGRPLGMALGRLANPAPDVVFNLVEGFAGSSGGEAHVTGLLELLGLQYTGCPPESQALCRSKGRTKALLRGLGLPTAPFVIVRPGDPVPRWTGSWPVIVKPESEDASLGIDQGSVVSSAEGMVEGVARLRTSHGPEVLVETFLPGREFNVGVLDLKTPQALPVAEVVYAPRAKVWPILTYAAKWERGSADDLASPILCPAEVAPALEDRLRALAVEAFRVTGCRDYARIDFRLDEEGNPMILEINPNPDIGPAAGLNRAMKAAGLDHDATLAALVKQALARGARHASR